MCLKKLVFHPSKVNTLAPSSVYSILPQCIYPRLLSCICVFFLFTAMHVKSLAFCVWEWRPYTQYNWLLQLAGVRTAVKWAVVSGLQSYEIEFIFSEKGKRKVLWKALCICVTYWRCEDYLKCKSRKDNSLMSGPYEHSHFARSCLRETAHNL